MPPEEGYYQELVESAPDALLVVDEQGIIQLVNRQGERLFGYPRDELVGQPVEVLVPDRAKAVHPATGLGTSKAPAPGPWAPAWT